MKLKKGTIIGVFAAAAVLAAAFFWGGDFAARGWGEALAGGPTAAAQSGDSTPTPSLETALNADTQASPSPAAVQETPPDTPASTVDPAAPVMTPPPPSAEPSAAPPPEEPDEEGEGEAGYTCELSITCGTLLDNLEQLEEAKQDLVPVDGVLFQATEVTFYEGESVFNVLRREMKSNRIHLEFVEPPLYQSAYIEGIGNLYEFDCGELSGWVYRVNGEFPSCGSSRCKLADGDKIEWLYTCDLGRDVGGNNGWGGVRE